MADRSEKNSHHAVTATVLFIGLLASLELYLMRDSLPAPFEVGLWLWVLGSVVAIVVLRALITESDVRRKAVGGIRTFSLLLCVLIGAYLAATPIVIYFYMGERVGIATWLLSALTGGMIIGGSVNALRIRLSGHGEAQKPS
jgi:hypothetical protein